MIFLISRLAWRRSAAVALASCAVGCCWIAWTNGASEAPAAEPPLAIESQTVRIAGPTRDELRGTWFYAVESPYLSGTNRIEVLPPSQVAPGERLRTLYLLPVEGADGRRWGDVVQYVRKLGLPDQHRLLCVYPEFDTLPWYGAHATNQRIRHAEYLRRVVVPLVESKYATLGTREGRLLLGFSKSGFGAVSLLLREPDFYGYAASWDAPLMMTARSYGAFQTDAHFGTPEQFEKYLPSRLLPEQARHFQPRARFVITGHDSFGPNPKGTYTGPPHTEAAHHTLDELHIPHAYNNDLQVRHHWETGWLEPTLKLLLQLQSAPQPASPEKANRDAAESPKK